MSTANVTMNPPKAKGIDRSRILTVLTIATAIGMAVAFALELFYAGTDVQQGDVQRLFYIHMGSFFGAFLAFGSGVFGGIAYLRTQNPKWDTLALASIEVGIVLAFLNLASGAIWARPIWNTWWTWDPRLTSAAVMELTYVAYLMLRNGIEKPETRRRFASIYGILAFSTVVFTLIVTRIRPDSIHPVVIGSGPAVNTEGGFAVTQGIGMTLGISITIWMFLLTPTLVWWRIRLQNLNERINQYKLSITEN